ncbi:uncharacterized protein LOC118408900 [Branchiostoma floridae]|uniref:Uncharacterized protein LOC118408900 n=1 Tax=Branchiostoma floridae TaxID=7739 RepID=A0A9J7HTL4_BRAFL|nr:uncharacterized protein LOC118408900 [Branchiostoma floridae]
MPRRKGQAGSEYDRNRWCAHCSDLIPKSTYYDHVRRYGDDACGNGDQPCTKRQKLAGATVEVSQDLMSGDPSLSSESDVDDTSTPQVMSELRKQSHLPDKVANSDAQDCSTSSQQDMETEDNGQATDGSSGNSDSESDCEKEDKEDTEIWSDAEMEEDTLDFRRGTDMEDINDAGQTESNTFMPLICLLLLLLAKWKSVFTISDSAVEVLLKIIGSILMAIGTTLCMETLKSIALAIPRTIYMFRKKLGLDRNDFDRYVVCPVCDSVYPVEDAVVTIRDGNGRIVRKKSAKCSHVEFPRHKQRKFRKPCGTILMKTVLGKHQKEFLYPKRTFCYRSVVKSLEDMLQRPDFIEACEAWRNRSTQHGTYTDVFDGQIWKDFQVVDGEPFLAEPCNLALMLNVDWFQPYKNIKESIGIMYLSVMNLPREQRFKEENIIVVGIIPGPHEPKLHINGFLEPLVEELQKLWKGLWLHDSSLVKKQRYRAALLCLACDIPAARKVAGFYGHMATKGCSKCLKSFTRDCNNRVDYSGFEEEFPLRSHQDHCRYAKRAKRAKNRAARERIEKEYGARYSSLHDLQYFNVINMHIVDVMHNLLEGTAKRVMQVWRDTGVLSKEQFCTLQARVDEMTVPSNIDSSIPAKIESSFEGFTAAQWKSWVCIYSLFALKGVIPEEDYNIWRLFVSATRLLCSRIITEDQLNDAHRCLKMFCNAFEGKYGKEWCTPNMHLHLHLRACIQDFGPVHAFWCFSFERANGSLGDYHSNNRHTEINMMRKWLIDWKVASKQNEGSDYDVDFASFFDKPVSNKSILTAEQVNMLKELAQNDDLQHNNFEVNDQCESMLPPVKRSSMSVEENEALLAMFQVLYPHEVVRVSLIHNYCDRYLLGGFLLCPSEYRKGSSSCIDAKWFNHRQITGEPIIDPSASPRPGRISKIWKVFVFLKAEETERKIEHTVAEVRWFKVHGKRYFYGMNSSCTVWEESYEPWSYASFLPMKRILNQCAFCTYKVPFNNRWEETVNVVSTLTSVRCV